MAALFASAELTVLQRRAARQLLGFAIEHRSVQVRRMDSIALRWSRATVAAHRPPPSRNGSPEA
jgi:hypothetical protein